MRTQKIALVLLALTLACGCTQPREKGEKSEKGEKAEKVEKVEKSCLDQSVPELLAEQCEHKIPTYQCDECRYETGVVKVVPSLLKQNGGLVSLSKPTWISPAENIELTGELQPSDGLTVHLAPRVSGVIRQIDADLGQMVSVGQPLFQIDSMELGEAKSDFLRKKALFELAQKNLTREERLQAARIGTGQELSSARTARDEAEIELRSSREKLLRLGLSSGEIGGLRPGSLSGAAGFLQVRSPIRGIVLERHAAIGEIVSPDRNVFRVADLSTLWVWLDVRAPEMAPILAAQRQGSLPVKLSVPAFPDKVFQGKLDFVNGSVDEASRTLKARATIQNPAGLLRPGMFCSVQLSIPAGGRAIAVPEDAVLSDAGRDFLFIHLKDDFYISRPVRVGKKSNGMVEVSGIAPQDTIVANGSFLLKSDMLRTKMGAGCAD